MANAVYVLCVTTSVACALMLLRGYRRSKVRLLMWSGLCFVGLALNNLLLLLDKMVFTEHSEVFPGIPFALARTIAAVIGLTLLLIGLIWDTE